jgi:broad specificity phosphatase PhoE
MSIILVRHGATALNRARILQPPDTALSAAGVAQADSLARALTVLRPAGLISSDLPRAMQTANAVAGACGLTVVQSTLLQERNFGELRGQAYDSLDFDPLVMDKAPPGGESAMAFDRRVELAFAEIRAYRASLAGPLVVISHGLVIHAILAGPVGLPPETLAGTTILNTAVTVIAARAPHRVELLNSTRHLHGEQLKALGGLAGG